MGSRSPETQAATDGRLAIALSGGGALAAYQVGVLRHLAQRRPRLQVPILTGASAGAINAAHLGAHRGSFAEAVEELRSLWLSIETDRVFRTSTLSTASILLRLVPSFLLGRPSGDRARGLVDTTPLRRFLSSAYRTEDGALEGVSRNIREGRLRSLGITTTHYATGRSITWIQGHEVEGWRRPHRLAVPATIGLDHIMSSAAIPFVFPAVRLGDGWHGDGGIRQVAPLSPALHLGASRILTVSMRAPQRPLAPAAPEPYPSPAAVLGVLLNAVFLDTLDSDVLHLNRITDLVESAAEGASPDLRRAHAFVVRPSRDLRELAAEHEWRLPRAIRYLLGRLGAEERGGLDFLSMILFEPVFIRRLMEVGEADAEACGAALVEFADPSGG